ncbi:MAG TPA: ATP-binding protein [Haliangiales bacterium]|nr:ATP-binding protein [Haliangiales bacterium]
MTAKRRRQATHDERILGLALLAALPAAAVALVLLWTGDYSAKVQWTLSLLVVGTWLGASAALRERVVRPLQTLANLLAALREGDFTIRARHARNEDPLGAALAEVNLLGQTLRTQRLGALEASELLARVMEEIDVAVFAFDEERRLRLANRAGERLLGRGDVLGTPAAELGLAACLHGDAPRTMVLPFPGGQGPWELRRGSFRQEGLPHELVVLTDVSRALREEELRAWQRLVRVLGHEINNSLTPIQSIALSLRQLLGRSPRPEDWEEDTKRGLEVVERRAEALSRFMTSYTRLARLPRPRRGPVDVGAWVRRTAELEKRLPVQVDAGPDVVIQADGDQLDQLLINLVRNAADAALETGGGVTLGWHTSSAQVTVTVADDGPGLSDGGNLFVPFFTTKPGGSGIGLVLSRQIAEAHRGTLALENRAGTRGAEARLTLPRA